ncbi:PAS domain-containing sensor histidine kinase [Flavobacterium phragmitis]|uniref:histidine kinase n=1 Tax=Flavobacterium phragmitis TaxID=739143 RepID=A0A1I1XMJ7_9FLAO|nr:PAS domain-containing sensor histidine kinase [Flavobacterium phragmitis]SFE08582.1 PAS domain S-box-containing protein [Flavobacterium phragmitis]
MKDLPYSLKETILRNVIDTAPFPIGVYTGHKMKIVLANQCMIKTYGKGPDVIGTNYTEILPELENQQIFDQLREVLHTGKPYEAKNARVDIVVEGVLKPHYFNYNFTPIFDSEGEIFGVMNTAADVTELNVARQQTLEIEKKLRLAVESSQLGTFEIDINKGIVAGSRRFASFFESKNRELDLNVMVAMIHTDDQPIWHQAIRELWETGDLHCEVRVASNGIMHWMRFSGTLSDSDDKENVIVGIAQDITEQKKNAQELLELVEQRTVELRRSNDDLKQFGHVVSHDLKEPVRKMLMYSNILKQNTVEGKDPRISQYAHKINKSALRLTEMIDSILNYSSSGSPDLEETVDLNDIIESIKEDLEIKIAEKSAVIEYSKMPVVRGSKILMHQLFYNLIANSLKFSRDNFNPHIKINHTADAESLKITVADNGIGIATGDSQRIFNAFERLHSKDQYEGTGLGLALCKKIVERHGGKMRNIDSESQGAVFEITLPATLYRIDRKPHQYNSAIT